MTKQQIEAKGVEINFTGTGLYWLSAPVGDINRGELALGRCTSARALCLAVTEAITTGTGDEGWSGWTAARA